MRPFARTLGANGFDTLNGVGARRTHPRHPELAPLVPVPGRQATRPRRERSGGDQAGKQQEHDHRVCDAFTRIRATKHAEETKSCERKDCKESSVKRQPAAYA